MGTANQVWESQIVDAEGRDLGSMLTEIPCFVTDVDAIVSAIEGHIRQARGGHEKTEHESPSLCFSASPKASSTVGAATTGG